MKKLLFLLIVPFFLVSCNLPSYVFNNQAQTTGLDYTQGKWLLNRVSAPNEVSDRLTALALKDFNRHLQGRLGYVPDTKGLLIPPKIGFNPSKEVLANLKKGTNYDYFINIKAAETKNDFGALDISPHKMNGGGSNVNEVTVEIYDLNLQQIIYSQKVTGSVGMPKDNQDVHVSKPSSSLIIGAYKKIIKDLEKRSVLK